MINREIYRKDPSIGKLVNDGVANVNDVQQRVVKYELQTFVCDGQYKNGLIRILDSFLKNLDTPKQPAVWISGFFGSGKSHMAKMLCELWKNKTFDDGSTARGIAELPQEVTDLLKELSTEAKRHGGLHAVSGTLGSGADISVRLALLGMVFKSVKLPATYPVARFVMWLKSEGIFEQVHDLVVQKGGDWNNLLTRMYMSKPLFEALVEIKPELFSSTSICQETILHQFPDVKDVSNDEMVEAIREALTKDGKFPLTLIVLDEVQQHIAEFTERVNKVQELVETCSDSFGGKLLIVGTGQTAITGTPNLQKIQGRFTVRVELSDADVEGVIRKVILDKKPEAIATVEQTMQANLGEISRHLVGTEISHNQSDIENFVKDYPILPVRRRFWEQTLRALDDTSTYSQLRNQLSLIHKVIQTNLDFPIGNVIPADYIYFESADKLLGSQSLNRDLHEKTMKWIQGNKDDKLKARACGLVYLINKIAGPNGNLGIKANVDTIADLMIDDLSKGSAELRRKLPGLLDSCDILIKVDNEYRIETNESKEWNNDYKSKYSALSGQADKIDNEREDRIRALFSQKIGKLSMTQGDSKVPRDYIVTYDSQLPKDHDKRIYVWVVDGWTSEESNVLGEARAVGNQSPTIFIYLPKRSGDELRQKLIQYRAAKETLDARGTVNTNEGIEARASIQTLMTNADKEINTLLDNVFNGARIYQSGGQEIAELTLQESLKKAINSSLTRLYPQFKMADHAGWSKVYESAHRGNNEDALKAVEYVGEVANNTVCKEILKSIAGGKSGADIRSFYESSPYGWSKDAIEGTLLILLRSGLIRAMNESGKQVEAGAIERKSIGKTLFKVESTTISTTQRIQIRKLFQALNITAEVNKESDVSEQFLNELLALAERAGGGAPKPAKPDILYIEDIKRLAGNDRLMSLFNSREQITKAIDDWKDVAKRIDARWDGWLTLKRLEMQAKNLHDAAIFKAQIDSIEQQRLLLTDPDPIAPLITTLTEKLRDALNNLKKSYDALHNDGIVKLRDNAEWGQLEPEQKNVLLKDYQLTETAMPKVDVSTTEKVLKTLDGISLSSFEDRVAAMKSRFTEIAMKAAKLAEPKVTFIQIPRRTLKSDDDLQIWLNEVKSLLSKAIQHGPVSPD